MEKNKNEVEEQDILDILLDENNDSPIVLYDEDDKAINFEQIAIIPEGEDIYVILKPIDEMEDVADDEAIVFAVTTDENGDSMLIIETNEEIAMKIFDKYYQLLDEAEAEEKENNAKKSNKK